MFPVRSLALLLAFALIPLGFGLSGSADHAGSAPASTAEGNITVTHHILVSFDGTPIHFTVFQPALGEGETVPLVLHSHGWGGSRATGVGGIVRDLVLAGYGVLSIDQRGHGDSGGYATILHRDHEVKDLIALVDWAYAGLDWVQKEGDAADKDLVLGAVGGSYGGGYQLMLASYDDRLDAIAPQMTWNDLRYSLAPNGVVKSTWVDALYGFGLQSVNMHPDIHRWFQHATLFNELPADAALHLADASPRPADITAATLLVQGVPDALFNWNEAWRNHLALQAAGTETALVGYLGGHVLPAPGQPVGGMGPARGGEPCGTYSDLALMWFEKHLRGDVDAPVPVGVSFALEDGTCVADRSLDDLSTVSHPLGVLPAPNTAGTVLVPVDAAPGVIAGVPRFEATFNGATETVVSVGLVKMASDGRTHVVDDQTAFVRLAPGFGEVSVVVDLEMTGVATTLDAGERLFLRIDGLHEWAPTGAGRTPGGGLFTDAVLTLPYVTG